MLPALTIETRSSNNMTEIYSIHYFVSHMTVTYTLIQIAVYFGTIVPFHLFSLPWLGKEETRCSIIGLALRYEPEGPVFHPR
jgi:hypothetical protein